MDNAKGVSATSVINMRALDPETISRVFTRVDLSWPKDSRATFVVSSVADLSLIRSKHRSCNSKSRRLERHMKDGEDGDYFACMPLKGGVEIRHLNRNGAEARDCLVKSNQLTLLSTREEYEIAMSDELEAIWLRVPAKLLQAHTISADEALGKSLDIQSGLGRLAKQMMYGAVANNPRLKDRGARIFAHSLLSFVGEIINSNMTLDQTGSRGRRKILKRAQDFIDEHLHDDDLSPQAIAQGVGISSRYLSEIFAAEGTSPMRWVRKRRLELCRMELERQSGGQQLICEIAYSMGFSNVSSFNRAFKAHFGQSPRDLMAVGGGLRAS